MKWCCHLSATRIFEQYEDDANTGEMTSREESRKRGGDKDTHTTRGCGTRGDMEHTQTLCSLIAVKTHKSGTLGYILAAGGTHDFPSTKYTLEKQILGGSRTMKEGEQCISVCGTHSLM